MWLLVKVLRGGGGGGGGSLYRVSLSGTFYLLLGVGRKTSSHMNERLLTGM